MNHFVEASNAAVITLKGIMQGKMRVLYVIHDYDGWQFLSGGDVRESDAMVVGLKRVLDTDKTLMEIGDLAEGWCAWRSSPSDLWQRAALE